MADQFSSFLAVRLLETGQYPNSWGNVINSDTVNLLDAAITGKTSLNLGSTVSYSMAGLSQGSASEARFLNLQVIGTPAAAVTITVPSSVTSKLYIIDNRCGQPCTFQYAAPGAGAIVPAAAKSFIWCDGTNCSLLTSSDAQSFGGRTVDKFALLAAVQEWTAGQAVQFVQLSDASPLVVDCTKSNNFWVQLTASRVIQLNTPGDGQVVEIWFEQDVTGGHTVTWPGNVKFEGGNDPGLVGTGSSIDRYQLTYNATIGVGTWIARAGLSAPSLNIGLVLDQNGADVNIFQMAGAPVGAVVVGVTIKAGVVIQANSTAQPALDFSGFAPTTVINLTNLGYVLGRGGDGGYGGSGQYPGSGITLNKATDGKAGGDAIKGPGAGITFNVTNVNGHIWGGGGGGGGGGISISQASNGTSNAGGGGGGAGGGRGGIAGTEADFAGAACPGTAGGEGSTGVNGTFGGAGVGANTGSGAASGSGGGPGGDWGAVGIAGTPDTTYTRRGAGGAAGAAGKSINLNGGTINFISGAIAPNTKGAVS